MAKKLSPLTYSSIETFQELFIQWGAPVDLLKDFFFTLASLIVPEINSYFNTKITEMVDSMKLESTDDANRFIQDYTNYLNSIMLFMEELEMTESDEISDNLIEDVVEGLIIVTDIKEVELASILIDEGNYILVDIIFEKYGISQIDDINSMLLSIHEQLGEKNAVFMSSFLILLEQIEEQGGDVSMATLHLAFKLIIVLVMNMNILRKDEQDMEAKKNASNGQVTVGQNDPCPCGSGLRYKVCCLKKLH
ncbi:MAG: SEC-C domain-containing protein [bacterium]|nr:SEC-C domain-containing protein [bacterium]